MKYVFLTVLCVTLTGCMRYVPVPGYGFGSVSAGYVQLTNTSSVNIPPGTTVPFAKIMDQAFASDYIGCDVFTIAEFIESGTMGAAIQYPMDGMVAFRCRPPGTGGEKHPFGGMGKLIVIPKEQSDLVFTLKSGDMIKLRGCTSVSQWQSNLPSMNNRNIPNEIIFVANSIEKSEVK